MKKKNKEKNYNILSVRVALRWSRVIIVCRESSNCKGRRNLPRSLKEDKTPILSRSSGSSRERWLRATGLGDDKIDN